MREQPNTYSDIIDGRKRDANQIKFSTYSVWLTREFFQKQKQMSAAPLVEFFINKI